MTRATDPTRRVEVVTTSSGAPALLDRDVGEVMHPVVGPLVESLGLYVAPSRLGARLALPEPSPLVLLDVGLGAGSNAGAAWRVALRLPSGARRLQIVSLDRDLAALRVASEANHAAHFGLSDGAERAVEALLDVGFHQENGHTWRTVLGELPASFDELPNESVDVVFWDPYSPLANPTLWTVAAFRAARRLCRHGATLHTYSSATAVRSALLLAGFSVGFGVPSGPKAHTTTAAVSVAELDAPLDARWLARLSRSSAPLPVDAPPDALERIARAPQFS